MLSDFSFDGTMGATADGKSLLAAGLAAADFATAATPNVLLDATDGALALGAATNAVGLSDVELTGDSPTTRFAPSALTVTVSGATTADFALRAEVAAGGSAFTEFARATLRCLCVSGILVAGRRNGSRFTAIAPLTSLFFFGSITGRGSTTISFGAIAPSAGCGTILRSI
jgi:hypothetical protein